MTELPDLTMELGPKMQALNERERRFVIEYLANGCRSATDAARQAGYSDNGGLDGGIRVRGYELSHRPSVRAAMQEVGRAHFGGLLLPAVAAAERILKNPKHPDHAKIALAVIAANGLGAQTRVDVNVTGTVEHRGPVVEARIKRAMDRLAAMGRSPAAFLPERGPEIEGEVVNGEPKGTGGEG